MRAIIAKRIVPVSKAMANHMLALCDAVDIAICRIAAASPNDSMVLGVGPCDHSSTIITKLAEIDVFARFECPQLRAVLSASLLSAA